MVVAEEPSTQRYGIAGVSARAHEWEPMNFTEAVARGYNYSDSRDTRALVPKV